MEALRKKLIALKMALNVLSKAIEKYQLYQKKLPAVEDAKDIFMMIRDSAIQRFEFTIDLVWKALRVYLLSDELYKLEGTSPRNVIRTAMHAEIITANQAEELIHMLEARNEIAHSYREVIAIDLMQEIPGYFVVMQQVYDELALKLSHRDQTAK